MKMPFILNHITPYHLLRDLSEGHIKLYHSYAFTQELPGLSNTLIRENLSLSVLWTPGYGYYYEGGYTLSEILFFAEIGVYTGFRNRSSGP